MFGPHRRKRTAFLAETAKRGLGTVKQGLSAASQSILEKKGQKALQNEMGGRVFGIHRHKRIASLGKFGDARLRRLKVGLGRRKTMHFHERGTKLAEAKECLDRTGGFVLSFLRSYGNGRKPAGNFMRPEGKAYVKDKTYD